MFPAFEQYLDQFMKEVGRRHPPRMDRPSGTMTVPHQAVATVAKLQLLHRGQERRGLDLDCLRQQIVMVSCNMALHGKKAPADTSMSHRS
jgi:hypothetical protein